MIKKLIKFIIILIIIFVLGIIGLGYKMYYDVESEANLETRILDKKKSNDYINFENLPEDYVKAVIDVEDHRFYTHKGVDIISIGRAVINNIKAKSLVEGGSTITQQVAKNLYFTGEKSIIRKVAELFVVCNLETNYTKEEIFEIYVNISYFGDGYYGIGQASLGYLGKLPKDMTLLECTLLAGIPNAPSVYAPTKNPDLAVQRQKQVIHKMESLGDLTKEQVESLYIELEN